MDLYRSVCKNWHSWKNGTLQKGLMLILIYSKSLLTFYQKMFEKIRRNFEIVNESRFVSIQLIYYRLVCNQGVGLDELLPFFNVEMPRRHCIYPSHKSNISKKQRWNFSYLALVQQNWYPFLDNFSVANFNIALSAFTSSLALCLWSSISRDCTSA